MRKETASKAGLDAYRDKRDPARTPEPFSAERIRSGATLRGAFVVHQHGARRMHYDLRLQVGGALKSFAVPHGPSLDPREKRLAVNTEDHPIEYLDFEDVIPAGNYGAGPMIVWDTGAVTYLEGSAEEGIVRGKIDFQLSGHKLRGRFALIHTGARAKPGTTERNQWLLIKKQDSHARAGTIDEPFSVLSGLKLDELAGAAELARSLEEEAARLGAKRGEVDTRDFTPMLCSNEGAELSERERLYELKLDGVRIIADRHNHDVELRYRKQRSASAAYPEIARAVRALPGTRLVLDGEVVAFDEQGRPSFQRLARRIHLWQPLDVRRAAAEVPVTYMVFDLLQLGAYDLRSLPLRERKRLLLALVRGRGLVRVLDHLEGDGNALYTFCREHELEGVVGKRMDAPYRAGPKRTNDWVKIKRQREADFVVAGWEESQKARKLRSLVLATYDGDRLVLRGKVGSGLDDATIDWFLARLAKSETRERIAEGTVTSHGKRHWVRPELVVNVEYAGFSESGVLRFPVYRGLREDLDPRDCRLAPPAEETIEDSLEQGPAPEAHAGLLAASDVAVRAQLSNQDKVFWPDEGYTKGDLCNYYASVAEALLPFLKGRPIVMVR
ncbi:MAG TPA: non-homologous end-joining DNA ligase, partial [Polyangiaceae bacterium]|nr:non-homologous end-joining DNA ligase [Polyangiaceae bacterium]